MKNTRNNKVIIIAETGVNHNGDFELAKQLIDKAKEAGADYIKFQTTVPEFVISTFVHKASYQINTTGNNESQLEMCKKIHFGGGWTINITR
jgi:sialic acid synthase SpsE